MEERTEQKEHKELFKEFEEHINELENSIRCIKSKLSVKLEIKEGSDYWNLKLELRAKKMHLKIQQRILKDRKNMYETIFLPKFEKESAETNANLEKVEERAKEFLNKKNVNPMIKQMLSKALKEYPIVQKKLKDTQEKQALKNNYYKALLTQIEK